MCVMGVCIHYSLHLRKGQAQRYGYLLNWITTSRSILRFDQFEFLGRVIRAGHPTMAIQSIVAIRSTREYADLSSENTLGTTQHPEVRRNTRNNVIEFKTDCQVRIVTSTSFIAEIDDSKRKMAYSKQGGSG